MITYDHHHHHHHHHHMIYIYESLWSSAMVLAWKKLEIDERLQRSSQASAVFNALRSIGDEIWIQTAQDV